MDRFGNGIISLRWIMLHMIEETAQHAGHLDIVQELIQHSESAATPETYCRRIILAMSGAHVSRQRELRGQPAREDARPSKTLSEAVSLRRCFSNQVIPMRNRGH